MKTTILLVAMTLSFAAQSQTLSNPIVLKNFSKDMDRNIWYTSRDPEEKNTRRIIGTNEDMDGYYQEVVEYFDFDPEVPTRVDGVVKIWEDDNYLIRVPINNHTQISIEKL
jgi:hypothetical protein